MADILSDGVSTGIAFGGLLGIGLYLELRPEGAGSATARSLLEKARSWVFVSFVLGLGQLAVDYSGISIVPTFGPSPDRPTLTYLSWGALALAGLYVYRMIGVMNYPSKSHRLRNQLAEPTRYLILMGLTLILGVSLYYYLPWPFSPTFSIGSNFYLQTVAILPAIPALVLLYLNKAQSRWRILVWVLAFFPVFLAVYYELLNLGL